MSDILEFLEFVLSFLFLIIFTGTLVALFVLAIIVEAVVWLMVYILTLGKVDLRRG